MKTETEIRRDKMLKGLMSLDNIGLKHFIKVMSKLYGKGSPAVILAKNVIESKEHETK